jgi:hypothetical protein
MVFKNSVSTSQGTSIVKAKLLMLHKEIIIFCFKNGS